MIHLKRGPVRCGAVRRLATGRCSFTRAGESGGGVMLIDVQGLGALSQLLALVIASLLLPGTKEHSERKGNMFPYSAPPAGQHTSAKSSRKALEEL